MKQSMYNFFYKLEDGNFLAFNALMNGLAVVRPDVMEAIDSLNPGETPSLSKEQLVEMEKGGFVCRDDFDEYSILVIRKNMQQYTKDGLGLTIAPTLKCNLACPYCYEPPSSAAMNDEVTTGIVDFLKKHIDSGIRYFKSSWFGGEPLLCIDTIEKLSSEFISICEANKVYYTSYIITNGVLFTRDMAERLKKLKVGGAQITIDGLKEIHDTRRPFRNGKGSFDRIWQNVKDAVGVIPISLRVNIDTNNAKHLVTFLNSLKEEEWFKEYYGDMFSIHYGYVKKYTSTCRCSKEESLKAGDFWDNELKLYKYLGRHGFGYDKYPSISSGCGATTLNSYVVGPEGELYKCWNHIGHPENVVGDIFHQVTPNSLYIDYLMESFDKDDECRECKYLPICMGGCVDIRVKAKRGEFDEKDCSGWRFYLADALKEYYLAKIKSGSN